jgi:hypothetical protein
MAVQRLTYNADIAPILNSNCIQCHSGPSPSAGRDLSNYNGVMTVATPFDPNSRIIQMTQPGGAMRGFLPDQVGMSDKIRRWIVDSGAPQQ